MDISPLEDIGLTNAEIKVYLTLLELGVTKVGPIIEKSGLQSSVVYNSLHKLMDKGLINYIKKGKINHYTATDPIHFIAFIEEKKANFERILPELLIKQKLAKERNEAEVYVGYKGVQTLLLELIKDGQKGDEFLFFSADYDSKDVEIQDFYKKYDPKRESLGLTVKGIAPERLKHLFVGREKERYYLKFAKQTIPPNMAIFKDTIAMFTWGDKPVGYLIYSKQLSDKYKQFFYSIWDSI